MTFSEPETSNQTMRAIAGTMMLMMVLASAGASVAFCEAICASAEAPAHHAPQAAAHPHAHAAQSSAPTSAMESGSGCKTLAQVSLLRRRNTLRADRQAAPLATLDASHRAHEMPGDLTVVSRFADLHGPPMKATLLVPLRV